MSAGNDQDFGWLTVAQLTVAQLEGWMPAQRLSVDELSAYRQQWEPPPGRPLSSDRRDAARAHPQPIEGEDR